MIGSKWATTEHTIWRPRSLPIHATPKILSTESAVHAPTNVLAPNTALLSIQVRNKTHARHTSARGTKPSSQGAQLAAPGTLTTALKGRNACPLPCGRTKNSDDTKGSSSTPIMYIGELRM